MEAVATPQFEVVPPPSSSSHFSASVLDGIGVAISWWKTEGEPAFAAHVEQTVSASAAKPMVQRLHLTLPPPTKPSRSPLGSPALRQRHVALSDEARAVSLRLIPHCANAAPSAETRLGAELAAKVAMEEVDGGSESSEELLVVVARLGQRVAQMKRLEDSLAVRRNEAVGGQLVSSAAVEGGWSYEEIASEFVSTVVGPLFDFFTLGGPAVPDRSSSGSGSSSSGSSNGSGSGSSGDAGGSGESSGSAAAPTSRLR